MCACLSWAGVSSNSDKIPNNAQNLIQSVLRERECFSDGNSKKRDRRLHFAESLVRRLAIAATFTGHRGCVNRLCWNDKGTLLASCSDDTKIIIWPYPPSKRKRERGKIVVPTQHVGNIFGVKFLPCTNDAQLVTGAMDCFVQLHHLERLSWDHNAHTTSVYQHTDRVKAVEVEPFNPYNFWAGSEDGTVSQFDTRALRDSNNILINCREYSDFAPSSSSSSRSQNGHLEVKMLSINAARPYQMALACGDAFVRIYDRRMLSPSSDGTKVTRPLMKLCPPHLALGGSSSSGGSIRHHSIHTTFVSFGNTGRRLVATWHGDHAYSFSIAGAAGAVETAFVQGKEARRDLSRDMLGGEDQAYYDELVNRRIFLFNSDGSNPDANCLAIDLLTRGLLRYPSSTILLRARADALLSRRWKGDASFALFDIEKALSYSPDDPDLRIVQISALHRLGQDEGANFLMNQLFLKHPKLNTAEAGGEETFSWVRSQISKAMQKREKATKVDVDTVEASKRREPEDESEESLSDYTSSDITDDDDLTDDDDRDEDEEGLRPSTNSLAEEDDADVLHNIQTSSFSNLWGKRECNLLSQRYIGQCNNQTDTKEVTFVGKDDSIIASGSDDGMVYLFDSNSGQLLHVLQADSDIVNCVAAHPSHTALATSGLENVVKIFEPGQSVKSSSNYSHSGHSINNGRVSESSYFPSPFSQRVNTNQEINNENFVRPLFSGADLYGDNTQGRVIFRALAQRFGAQMQEEGANPDGTVNCPIV